ncbi:MAG: HNH endonuclease [Acidobacteria bacterium]|nr:MAG: HNH endonuclease [Acidobacteriota bacterium]
MLRSATARAQFLRQTGYPHGRPGFVVDHIVPLECGGADSPGNMQWQTIAEAKAKDRTERNCRR